MNNPYLKIAILLLILTGISGVAKAQADRVHFGVKAGVSLMTLGSAKSNGSTANFSYKPGLQAGIFYEIPLGKDVVFSPQLLYTQKGGKINNGSLFGVQYTSTTSLNYLDIPLLFGFNATLNSDFM